MGEDTREIFNINRHFPLVYEYIQYSICIYTVYWLCQRYFFCAVQLFLVFVSAF
jgi:hypothetical protein